MPHQAPTTDEAESPIARNAAELAWLIDNWVNEFWFLRQYGQSPYKDEDREEGRRLLQALMKADDTRDTKLLDPEVTTVSEQQVGEDTMGGHHAEENPAKEDLVTHTSDHQSSVKQLDFIEQHDDHGQEHPELHGKSTVDLEPPQSSPSSSAPDAPPKAPSSAPVGLSPESASIKDDQKTADGNSIASSVG